MSDDVTNLAAELCMYDDSLHHMEATDDHPCWHCKAKAKDVLATDWLAERDATNRLAGAARANSDAIAAYAELVERVEALADGLLAPRTPEFDSKAAHPELAYRRCKVTGCNMWGWGQGTASPDDLRYCVAHDTAATIADDLRALIDPEATS